MEKTGVQKLAGVLKVLVIAMMALNVIALLFVPWLVTSADELHLFLEERVLHLLRIQPYGEDDIVIPIIFVALAGWGEVWQDTVCALYTLFLLICGVCCFVILKQAKGILNTVLEGMPFQMANARSMRRAAVCCWIITGMAAVRLIGELIWLKNTAPIYTYNTLFIPIFLMGGLLFLVMSALFRQAAELKEDQDLTI